MSSHPLAGFSSAPRRSGLFLDFDGTLGHASTPEGAVPRPGVPDLLCELHRCLGRVAIVSGRPVAYLAPHIPESVDIVGLYGLEWRFGGRHHTLREAEKWRPVIQELTDEAVARFGESVVEPKGLSLTIHYRADSELRAPMQAWSRTWRSEPVPRAPGQALLRGAPADSSGQGHGRRGMGGGP